MTEIGGRALVGAQTTGNTTNGAIFVRVDDQVAHPLHEDGTYSYDFLVAKLSGWVSSQVAR